MRPDMRSVGVIVADGGHVEAIALSRYGMRAHLISVLRPGWCWLQSRFLVIGMAAVDVGVGRTRVAVTGGVRLSGRHAIVPIGVRREAAKSPNRLSALLGNKTS